MSEQFSGTHGPVRDEAIKRQDEAEAREYSEEWPQPEEEPDDRTEREAIWAPAARLAESPVPEDWEAVELRSDLEGDLEDLLQVLVFPVERHFVQLIDETAAHGPPV